MRNLAAAVALALVAAFGFAVPVSAVQTSTAKVVIIVGATHDATAGYRTNADIAYNEAIKYTKNVTKVYSPNATWSAVKAAVKGANVVIYFGHGNGWPSPYTYDPLYTTKDGFGLNADLNGDGKLSDYENKYYGEPYMAQLGLAPNAIVMLHNLCYASGNSEPGGTAPTVSVARQRIDNYAAGFIKGGAKAVLADGHMGPSAYLQAFFTTGETILDAWRGAPDYHGHESSFASTRSPGFVDYSDPDTTTGGYYRSLVVKPGLTTTAVTNAVGDTGADPATLVVPGRASVEVADAPLFAAAPTSTTDAAGATPLLDLAQGTRLKTVATAVPATSTDPAIIQVQGLDDPSIQGYVSAASLAPRDSRPPVLIGIDSGTGQLSPNGDGRADDLTIQGIFSEANVAWTLTIRNAAGAVVDTTSGTGQSFEVPWDGLADGVAVPDGTYTWTATGTDAWLNGTATGKGTLVVDTVAPDLSSISPDGSSATVFTPNGDGVTDTIVTSATTPEAGTIQAWVTDWTGATVRAWATAAIPGTNAVTWDGKTTSGAFVAGGDYTIHLAGRDVAGNQGAERPRPVHAVTFLKGVTTSSSLFYPQDGDRLATSVTLSLTLAKPATVTWTVRTLGGVVVATHLSSAALPAGTQTWVWNGRNDAGTLLGRGRYDATVTATDGVDTISQSTRVEMNAFRITTSTTTAKRGSTITVSAVTAEGLSTTPRLYVSEPGLSTWSVTMSKVNSKTWRATVRMKAGGSAGTVSFKVWARDTDGRSQATIRKLKLL